MDMDRSIYHNGAIVGDAGAGHVVRQEAFALRIG